MAAVAPVAETAPMELEKAASPEEVVEETKKEVVEETKEEVVKETKEEEVKSTKEEEVKETKDVEMNDSKDEVEKEQKEEKDASTAPAPTPEKTSTDAPSVTPRDIPEKPKKAVSAFWVFSSEVREKITEELKKENEGKVQLGAVAKQTATRWQALPAEERKVYEDKAAADKERYERELVAYKEFADPAGALRAKYVHLMPKRPPSAQAMFTQDEKIRAKAVELCGEDQSPKNVTAKLVEMWKSASLMEKAPFVDRNHIEQGEFLKKQRAWQMTPEFAEIERAVREQEERRKIFEAEQKEREEREKRAALREARMAKKRAKEGPAESSPNPKSRKSIAKEPVGPYIDEKVLKEAVDAGLEDMFRNLHGRAEVMASGKPSSEILKALKECNGFVNQAKNKLLAA